MKRVEGGGVPAGLVQQLVRNARVELEGDAAAVSRAGRVGAAETERARRELRSRIVLESIVAGGWLDSRVSSNE